MIERLVYSPRFGYLLVRAASDRELHEKIAEIRRASLDY
jgi:hypothetical protein